MLASQPKLPAPTAGRLPAGRVLVGHGKGGRVKIATKWGPMYQVCGTAGWRYPWPL